MPLDPQRQRYLEAMGIPLWELREDWRQAPSITGGREAAPTDAVGEAAESADAPAPVAISLESGWEVLQQQVTACTACADLAAARTQTVFGVGDHQARWMIIGEAPGADEDAQGEPFVGRAGQLLTEMIQACGQTRAKVYIANVLKCRPPNNRNPQPDEIARCLPFLQRQIELVAPDLILCVGAIAAQTLLESDAPVGRLRGRVHAYGPGSIPLVVTYHPAYLLRSPLEKRKAWDDLRMAMGAI